MESRNVKIARELVRLARTLVSADMTAASKYMYLPKGEIMSQNRRFEKLAGKIRDEFWSRMDVEYYQPNSEVSKGEPCINCTLKSDSNVRTYLHIYEDGNGGFNVSIDGHAPVSFPFGRSVSVSSENELMATIRKILDAMPAAGPVIGPARGRSML